MDILEALDAISSEYHKARTKFKPMYNYHEGYAILKEEVDELWDEIKNKGSSRESRDIQIRKEAIQVGAMALAFLIELDRSES